MQSSTPPYQLPPLEDAKRQYVELFGSALVMNTYLKIALLGVSAVAVGLLGGVALQSAVEKRRGMAARAVEMPGAVGL